VKASTGEETSADVMDINRLAKAERDVLRKEFTEKLKSNINSVMRLAESFSPVPTKCSSVGFISGAYNFCIRLGLDSGARWIIRFPFPTEVSKIAEKLEAEVATMKLVAAKCSEIPIPRVISFGQCGPGPLEGIHFLIMEELEGRPMDTVWNTMKGDEEIRRKIFLQLARIVLSLSQLRFNDIGSLRLTGSDVSNVRLLEVGSD
jgi:aminoglycoside phosphotransferase (APT) family kinase protein